jgi:hypothetical protein
LVSLNFDFHNRKEKEKQKQKQKNEFACSLQLKFFSLEGDSKIVIAALTTPSITIDWHIDTVIANTLALLPTAFLWEAKKIHRSANFYVHHVAY